jgi:hypothetical protein
MTAFMLPEVVYLDAVAIEELKKYNDEFDEAEPGYYHRLSASGFVDSTDWTGPFESEEQAFQACQELHGIDLNGDSLDYLENDDALSIV